MKNLSLFLVLLLSVALISPTKSNAQWVQTNGRVQTNGPFGCGVYCFAVSGTNLFAGMYGGDGVLLSTNNCTSWNAVKSGLTRTDVFELAVSGTNLFAGTRGGTWRRPLSDFGTSSVSSSDQPAGTATISPNPITESATIRFHSDIRGRAELRVVNLLGIEVAEIFSGELDAGEHSFTWNTIGVPAGMYMCTVRSIGSIEKVPMLVVR